MCTDRPYSFTKLSCVFREIPALESSQNDVLLLKRKYSLHCHVHVGGIVEFVARRSWELPERI